MEKLAYHKEPLVFAKEKATSYFKDLAKKNLTIYEVGFSHTTDYIKCISDSNLVFYENR